MASNALSATSKTLAHSGSALDVFMHYAQGSTTQPGNHIIVDVTYNVVSACAKTRYDQQRANREANVLEMINHAYTDHKLLHKVDDHA